jgi:hypothetical protein
MAAAALIRGDGASERAWEGADRQRRAREELRASFYRWREGGGMGRRELDGQDAHARDGKGEARSL